QLQFGGKGNGRSTAWCLSPLRKSMYKWHSAYPTSAHERRGKEVGLPADKVEALIAGRPTSFSDEREQVVYEIGKLPGQFALGAKGPLRPRGQGTRPCRHHRRDHIDGLRHQRLDDPGLLRRAGRGPGHRALSNFVRTDSQRARRLGVLRGCEGIVRVAASRPRASRRAARALRSMRYAIDGIDES